MNERIQRVNIRGQEGTATDVDDVELPIRDK
jgi:hypothetical protein